VARLVATGARALISDRCGGGALVTRGARRRRLRPSPSKRVLRRRGVPLWGRRSWRSDTVEGLRALLAPR